MFKNSVYKLLIAILVVTASSAFTFTFFTSAEWDKWLRNELNLIETDYFQPVN